MSVHLSETDITDFHRCGVTVLRGVLTPEQVQTLKEAIDREYKRPGHNKGRPSNQSPPRKGSQDFPHWTDVPEYQQIFFRSQIPQLVATLIHSQTIRLHHHQIHVGLPCDTERIPWHSDYLFYNVNGRQAVSVYVAVDPVPEGEAEFVLGTQKLTPSMPECLRERLAKSLAKGVVPEPPDVNAHRKELPVVSWALQPGDCFVFHFNTLHFLGTPSSLRRGVSIRYVGDDAVYASRPWTTFPCFPELEKDDEGMKPGCPLTHSVFPVVYTTSTKL